LTLINGGSGRLAAPWCVGATRSVVMLLHFATPFCKHPNEKVNENDHQLKLSQRLFKKNPKRRSY
jgi:hypothetical protein